MRVAFAVALGALVVLTALFRFMALTAGFTNDQFLHLAGAQQILLGEWPTRDFLDAGMPLMYVLSAAAQLVLGQTLFAEGVLVASAYALAALCTALAVRELTGSRLIAIWAALIEVAILPRAYGYPKVLTYAAGFYLIQRYVSRPTPGRSIAMALAVAGAFLLRHDHGIYLGGAATIAVLLADPAGAAADRVRKAARFIGLVAAATLPYLIYVQAYGGLWAYLQKGLEFRRREFERAEYVLPSLAGDMPLHAALLYEYWLFPVAAVLVLAWYARRSEGRALAARVAPVVLVAVLLNIAFLRPPYEARLPDAIAPAAILAAWLIAMAWRGRPAWLGRPVAAAAALLVAATIVQAADTAGQLERAGLLRQFSRWPAALRETRAKLEAPHHPDMLPSAAAEALVPFFDYAGRCLPAHHRILIVGIVPEAVYFSHRGFAGGQPIIVAGYFQSEAYQRNVLRHLAGETVPVVLLPGTAYAPDFDASFPLVAGYVRSRYAAIATLGDDAATQVQVLFNGAMTGAARDGVTGWPCLVTDRAA